MRSGKPDVIGKFIAERAYIFRPSCVLSVLEGFIVLYESSNEVKGPKVPKIITTAVGNLIVCNAFCMLVSLIITSTLTGLIGLLRVISGLVTCRGLSLVREGTP